MALGSSRFKRLDPGDIVGYLWVTISVPDASKDTRFPTHRDNQGHKTQQLKSTKRLRTGKFASKDWMIKNMLSNHTQCFDADRFNSF